MTEDARRLLIVEDNDQELAAAREAAERAGYAHIVVARTLAEAIAILDGDARPTHVLSDLFFPAGNDELAAVVKGKLLPRYEGSLDRLVKGNPLATAIFAITDLYGTTPRETLENWVPLALG